MKRIGWLAVVSLILIVSGSIAMLCGSYEGKIAQAHESFVVLSIDEADGIYEEIQHYIEGYDRYIPLVFDDLKDSLEIERVEFDYWRNSYDSVTAIDSENSRVRFIVANALYRSVQGEEDVQIVLAALDSAINNYSQSIETDGSNFDAVFNYEYLLTVRDKVVREEKPLPIQGQEGQNESPHGIKGKPAEGEDMSRFKIWIPASSEELGGTDAGKGEFERKSG
jgi:hypothetical protein